MNMKERPKPVFIEDFLPASSGRKPKPAGKAHAPKPRPAPIGFDPCSLDYAYAIEPWDSWTKLQVLVTYLYNFYYAGFDKGNPNLWYSQNVTSLASFRRLFEKMLGEVPRRWRAPRVHVPDPACPKCKGKGGWNEMEHDYMGRKGLDILRSVPCLCGKDRLMTRKELGGGQ